MLFKILENISSSWITKKGYHAKKWVCLKMRDTPQKTEKRRPRFVGNRLDLGTSKHCLRHTDIPWHTAICVSLIRIDINTNTCRYIIMLYMYVDINTIYFYIYVYIYTWISMIFFFHKWEKINRLGFKVCLLLGQLAPRYDCQAGYIRVMKGWGGGGVVGWDWCFFFVGDMSCQRDCVRCMVEGIGMYIYTFIMITDSSMFFVYMSCT